MSREGFVCGTLDRIGASNKWAGCAANAPAPTPRTEVSMREKRTCIIDGCGSTQVARGVCNRHYKRLAAQGRLPPLATVEDRFWGSTDKSDSCWLWTGTLDTCGYGQIKSKGKTLKAHRFAYELLVGPIPDGLQLDHLCRVRNCVNPDHLEPVTQTENVRRGTSFAVEHAAKTHCPQGHPYEGDNLYIIPTTGSRSCKACHAVASRKYKARQREARRKDAA